MPAQNPGAARQAATENSTVPQISRQNSGDVTRLLDEFRVGNQDALNKAFEIVYAELRRLARRQLRREKSGHTLAPTALVHEAYLKLVANPAHDWYGRTHFFCLASRAMRQILTDHARRQQAQKRGNRPHQTTLDERIAAAEMNPEELLALDAALDDLEVVDARLRTVVEYRFFCGLDEQEIAGLLHVSPRTVERDWVRARAWLYRHLYKCRPEKK